MMAQQTEPSETSSILPPATQFSADWTHLTVAAPERREAVLLDPFESEPTEEFTQLMGVLPNGSDEPVQV